MRIEYREADLAHVLRFWSDKYQYPDGRRVTCGDAFVDTGKGRVIFKLYVEGPEPFDLYVEESKKRKTP